jgi:hypothetical protein
MVDAKRDGFNPDVVNVMAMNNGASIDNGGQMGRDALTATSNTALQVKAASLTSRIGVIPMIGVNDVSPEVFTLADARLLADIVRNAVPDAIRPGRAIVQSLWPAALIEIVPANGMDGSPARPAD